MCVLGRGVGGGALSESIGNHLSYPASELKGTRNINHPVTFLPELFLYFRSDTKMYADRVVMGKGTVISGSHSLLACSVLS